MEQGKKIKALKYSFIISSVLLVCCVIGLILITPFWQQHELTQTNAEYYPGSGDTAFLLLAPTDSTAHIPLLREISSQGYPVQVSYCNINSNTTAEEQSDFVESESQMLSSLSGVKSDQQIWIGLHDGGGALMDQVVFGSEKSRMAVLLSPSFDHGLIDDAIIVDGNYKNFSDWVNSLSPSLVRQPLMLMTSNGDDTASPYDMTLVYNKLSSDEIIHVGGVYHADDGKTFLSIIDGGSHPIVPINHNTITEVKDFVNSLSSEIILPHSFVPQLRNILTFAVCTLLLACTALLWMIAPQYAPSVSYGLPDAVQPVNKLKLFSTLGLSILCALLLSPLFWLFVKKAVCFRILYMFIFLLLCISISFLLLSKLFSFKLPKGFKAVGSNRRALISSLLINLAAILPLLLILKAGYPHTAVPSKFSLAVIPVYAAVLVLPLKSLITIDELLSQEKSPAWHCLLYAFTDLPLLILALAAFLFLGSTPLFQCIVYLFMMLLFYLVALAASSFSGQKDIPAIITSLSLCLCLFLFHVY